MLKYGETFLESNKDALDKLKTVLTPEAFRVALEMAPKQDDEEAKALEEDEEEPVAA
ncbi:hypothetical protein [Rhizobium ruizarguesonis]|uniref:hypothetical protein n=1 Tax=Rhizobium ruizarguesonis TaxID=2081791 RepID=UPI0013EF064D|nr:hypothetical protein [Rhizobium ruizarguesonis]